MSHVDPEENKIKDEVYTVQLEESIQDELIEDLKPIYKKLCNRHYDKMFAEYVGCNSPVCIEAIREQIFIQLLHIVSAQNYLKNCSDEAVRIKEFIK